MVEKKIIIKNIGIFGGLSPASTVSYYKKINDDINKIYGGMHAAFMSMISVNLGELMDLYENKEWEKLGSIFGNYA
jgi:aspartate racemase